MGTRFDTVTREMRAIDRKTTLKVLGGSLAALAAASPLSGAARSKDGKKRDKGCRSIEKSCKTYWNDECGANQMCRDHFQTCCALLGDCKGDQYFGCTSNIAM